MAPSDKPQKGFCYLLPDDDSVDEGREESGYVGDGVGDAHERAGVVGAQVADVDHVAGDLARRQRRRHHHRRDRLQCAKGFHEGRETFEGIVKLDLDYDLHPELLMNRYADCYQFYQCFNAIND